MEKLLDLTAYYLGTLAYFSAVAGAGAASANWVYQPKTPQALLK